MPMGDDGPSSRAFSEANNKMHKGMMIEYSGNAVVDFVRGMIAHHQGAIDMAKVELQYGKDADMQACRGASSRRRRPRSPRCRHG